MGCSRKRLSLWLGVPLIAVATSSCHPNSKAARPKESQAERLDGLFARSHTVLNYHKRGGGASIPFTLRDDVIYLKMVWAGRPVEAMLDTGSIFTEWPESLHLAGTQTGMPQDSKMAAGVISHGEWVVLPSIKAGDCEWRDVPTVRKLPALNPAGLKVVRPLRTGGMSSMRPEALLGAPAFHATVLTIDYQKKEITIWGADHDITRLPRHPHDLLFTQEWVYNSLPVLEGSLGGRPARFALDSGCAGIPINSRFAARLPLSSFGPDTTTKINGVWVRTRGLKHISGTIAGVPFNEYKAQVVDMPVPADVDALVGTGFLGRFRVTIDYTRHKVLLEPYSGEPR